ncbi:MAG: efflux RND transporter periplasmic adaptor subunit [Candidatus Sulfotelmatobacter sp.]
MNVDTNEHPITDPSHQLTAHGSEPRRHKLLWIITGIVLLLLLVLAAVLFWRHHENAEKKPAAPPKINITAATAQKGNIGVYLDEIGTVTPVYTDSITSQVTGVIAAVHYKEGQLVRKGDPLVDIDPRPYQATLLQAQGALERDQSLLAQAQMDLDRYRIAWSRNAIQKQLLDDQEKIVQQDEGTVKNDQGTVQYDEVQLAYCHITAPIAGRVGLRLVDPGNLVQSTGTVTLAVITQLEPITVIFTVPEDSLGPVITRLQKKAKLTVDAFDRTAQTKIASGTLLTLDNQIDTTTGTVKARSVFANKNDALFPNQFVNVRLLVNTLQGVILVPASTVQQNGSASFVYVIQNNIAHIRTVKPGVTDGGVTQVEGINPGDVVANSSFDKLQDNVAVTVAPTGAAKPAPASTNGNSTSGSSAP